LAGLVPIYGQRLVGQPKELNHGRGLFDYTKWFGTLAVLFCDSSTPEPTRVSQAAVPAAATEVRYRPHYTYTYPAYSYWGYPTNTYWGYPGYAWGYPGYYGYTYVW
jgi:hypothetical protein